jgi:thiol-disulfide isomerase/thioredoxin
MHSHHVFKNSAIFFSGVILTFSLCFGSDEEAITTPPLAPGNEAPTFSLPSLTGTREALNVWCGSTLSKPYVNNIPHTVILSFWATYCKPCQREIPELEKFAAKHSADNIKIFLISIDKEASTIVAPFVAEKKYSLPVILDPYRKTAERYLVKSLPALVVISPDGIIRYSSVGFKENEDFGAKLETIYTAIRDKKYDRIPSQGTAGDAVAVKGPAATAPTEIVLTPKQKWQAVAKVECGTPIAKVASETGVTADDVQAWYNDLKKAALELWK